MLVHKNKEPTLANVNLKIKNTICCHAAQKTKASAFATIFCQHYIKLKL